MANIDQVKYDIERCISHVPDACRDCSHYWGKKDGDVTAIDCMEKLLAEAYDLLKKQEAKTGTWQWKIHGKAESGGTLGEAICDKCGKSTYATAVKGDLNYCPNCGAKMTDRM